tara:strand:- start:881 stop:1765 length:885 start_codon:yes stop_codon:yes gene_type:complete
MAYIGQTPEDKFRGLSAYNSFVGDGSTTAFDLSADAPEGGQNDIQVFVADVRQQPGALKDYTLGLDGSGNIRRITFASAPAGAADIFVINPGRRAGYLFNTVSDNTITTAKIQDGAITADKIADGTIIDADIADGSITGAKINSTFNISAKTVTLPATSVTNDMLAGSIANNKLTNSSVTVNGSTVALGASVEISAGTSWQTVITGATNAVAGNGYFVNTTSGSVTVTLPASPTLGEEVSFIDYAGTFDTNALTVGRNSKNIQGSAADLTVSTERAGFTLVFTDDTQGWLLKDK